MSDSDYFEFGIAHDRRYTLEHLWLQLLDEKDGTVKIGMSEFIRADFGDVVRVILPHPQDTSEFLIDEEGTDDDGEEGESKPKKPSSGDEIGIGELLVTIRTVSDRILINSPFPCKVLELNGEVEDNADLANDDAFGDGWFLIVKPHEFDEDQYLDAGEYIEYLNEL
jgi:glycine cleavage system H protein